MSGLNLSLEPVTWALLFGALAVGLVHVLDRVGKARAIRRTREAIARFVREPPDA